MNMKAAEVSDGMSANDDKSVLLARQEDLTVSMLHARACFEVICVLAGKCRHAVDGMEEELREGDLCLVPPRAVHLVSAKTGSRVIYILMQQENMENVFYNILRDRNEISDFMLNSVYGRNGGSCRTFHTGTDQEIRRQILEMYAEQQWHRDAGSDRIVISMLVIFFTRLMRQYRGTESVPGGAPEGSGDVGFMRDILRDYRTITLSELAKRLNYSVPYCSKYIMETTGQTFLQILHGVRFRKAENYLCGSSFSVQKISALIGYESPENFIRAFKKEYGVSPAQYRAAHT